MSTETEVNNMSDMKSIVSCSHSLCNKKNMCADGYVFHVDISNNQEPLVAASLSNNEIRILNLETLQVEVILKGHEKSITNMKFSTCNANHLFSSSEDGRVLLWDLREHPENAAQAFMDVTETKPKPICSFDVDKSEKFLCGGTELFGGNAFLLFWDCRSTKLLGGYWDCHTADVTDIAYHPQKTDHVASSGVDGLINVYDISQTKEEDALQLTLNTDSSCRFIRWIDPDLLAVVTNTEDLQVWDVEEASRKMVIKRQDFAKKLRMPSLEVDYFVDMWPLPGGNSWMLLTGTNDGIGQLWKIENWEISLWSLLERGHTDSLRCIKWAGRLHALISGGEDGSICSWRRDDSDNPERDALKDSSAFKKSVIMHRKKPY